jgi:hypothetical protein
MGFNNIFLVGMIVTAMAIAGCHRKSATAASGPVSGDINSPMYWLARAEAEAPACPTTAQSGVEELCAQGYADLGDESHFRAAAAKAVEFSKTLHDPHFDLYDRWVFAPAYAELGDQASFDKAVKAAFEPHASGDYLIIHKLMEIGLYDDAAIVVAMQINHDTRAWYECDMAVAMAKAGKPADYEKMIRQAEKETAEAIAVEKDPRDRQNSTQQLARAAVTAGDAKRADKLLKTLPADESAGMYADLASARLDVHDTTDYSTFIDKAVALAATTEAFMAGSSYQEIGRAMASANDESAMKKAVAGPGEASHHLAIEFYFRRAEIVALTGDVDAAMALLKKADDLDAKVGDDEKYFRFSGLKHWKVMFALAKAGKDDAALAMAAHAPPLLEPTHPALPEQIYPHIAEAEAARGDFAAAIKTMNRIRDRALRETNGTNVGQYAARDGQPLEPARDWIDGFAKPMDRAEADIQIARALIRRSKGWTNDLDE